MLSRRALVGKLAAGTAGAAVVLAASGKRADAILKTDEPANLLPSSMPGEAANQNDQVASAVESAPPPWEILSPLALQSEVSTGWRISGLSAVESGSFVVTLSNEKGREQRVHICRNSGEPQGLYSTPRLDLVLMNGGQGDTPTDESLARAVVSLAQTLARNEGHRSAEPLMTALLSHSERMRELADSSVGGLR